MPRRLDLIQRQLTLQQTLNERSRIMPQANEVDSRVTKVLVQALGVEEEDVRPAATLQGDLGAESIDFLDIVFRLEREFMIRIPRGELFSELLLQDPAQILRDGRVTDAGLDSLRATLPYADLSALECDRRLNRINDLFTVDLLSSYVAWRLGGNKETTSDRPELASVI
jgi:acyl carrier protein